MLAEFAKRHKLALWTPFSRSDWAESRHGSLQNGATKNEIDNFMTNRPDIFLDVLSIKNLSTGSDHCMTRWKEKINTKFERVKLAAQPKKADTGKLQHHRREFQVDIQNRFAALTSIPSDDIDSGGDATAKMIHEAAISVAGRYKREKPDKLSTGTKQLREKHRKMKRNGTPTDSIDYSEIYKAIRREMKEDIRKHDEKYIIEAIESRKSLKQGRQTQRLGKGQPIYNMEEDGTHIHDKERIVKRCVKFCEELYRLRRASTDQGSHDDLTTTPPWGIYKGTKAQQSTGRG